MAPPLTEHVKEEPVSDVALLHDRVDHLSPDEPEPDVQEVCAHLRADDNDDPGRMMADDVRGLMDDGWRMLPKYGWLMMMMENNGR